MQVLDAATVIDASAMLKWVEQHPIDVLKIVPSHLSALLVSKDTKALIPRRALVLGGEALKVGLLERLQELGGECKVFNHYGPTETTIGVLVNEVAQLREGEQEPDGTCPAPLQAIVFTWMILGQPVTNTEVYVLDRRMQLVPNRSDR